MRYRKLGRSDVLVSEISLGCWTLGGRSWSNGVSNGWADVDEKEVAAAVDWAMDHGVNHFDNADVYGDGAAERLLARVLGARRDKVVIASKVGWFRGTAAHAYEPKHIRHQCEQSLVNLKRDHIDLYYFHHADFGHDDALLEDAVEVMGRLREEGKIRLLGLSAYSVEDFVRLVPRIEPDVLQGCANCADFELIDASSAVRKMMDERGLSLVAFSPLKQGLLLGKYTSLSRPAFQEGDHRKDDPDFSPESLAKLLPRIERMKERFGSDPAMMARAALQCVLSVGCVACVIPGFRSLRQVQMNLAGCDHPLDTQELQFLRNLFAA